MLVSLVVLANKSPLALGPIVAHNVLLGVFLNLKYYIIVANSVSSYVKVVIKITD